MDYIIFSAVWHSIISIAILIAMVKKKDIIDIMSYCCIYHVLTLCFVARESTNENITPNNFGILTFVYVILGCLFYMVYCIIQEKKKQKEEKEDYVSNKNAMDKKDKVINIVIILLCVFALYINYIDKYKMIGLLCIGMMGVLALCKNRGKEEKE